MSYEVSELLHLESPGDGEKVILDCLGLSVKSVSVGGRDVPFSVDEANAKLNIENVGKDAREIKIRFSGKASQESLHGLYKSSYGSEYLLTTDLEPIGARRVFPCVDDPSSKAVFNVQVKADKNLKVLFNTRVAKREDLGNGKVNLTFEPTPKMSTYLFYLGVGAFEEISLRAADGEGRVDFIVASSPGQAHKGKFALENAVKFLSAYEEYFSIKYPLEKLHLIAIPEYPSGAMENWGAITFREVALLVDQNTSVASRRRVVEVIGHEIAHMWFGDLVTMKWWNDLWLNESFATFMEHKMTDELYPEWNIWSDFLLQLTADAQNGDALSGTHPIEVEVRSPEEVSQIFDEISYGKGASTLRMIEAYVGAEAFRRGVAKYLKNFSYGNAEGRNLWKSIAEASKQPVEELMEAWVKKPGYPLVRVSLKGNKLHLKQDRFLLSGARSSPQEAPWPIPLVAMINGEQRRVVFNHSEDEITVGSVTSIKLNAGQTGFYRVLYDEELYSLVKKDFRSMSSFDKWGVVTDLFAFLVAGLVDKKTYLEFVELVRDYGESDYIVVDALTDQLKLLKRVAKDSSEVASAYHSFNRAQISRLGVDTKEGEPDTDRILRGRIAFSLAINDDEFAREIAQKFEEYHNVDPNIRAAVAVAYARTNGSPTEAFQKLVSTIKKMRNEADTIKLFQGLVAFKHESLVRKALDLSLSGEFNRADAISTIITSGSIPENGEVVWRWVESNINKIKETFTGTYILASILQDTLPFAGLGREQSVKEYFEKNSCDEASMGIRKGLEMLEIYSRLANRL